MARVKLSPIISAINGKLGNVVFQENKSGIILRERIKPRNPNTAAQVASRSRLASVKTAWQVLTTANRDSWIALAQFFNKKTKFNQQKSLTAYELFIQHNAVRDQGNFDILENTTLFVDNVDAFTAELRITVGGLLNIELEAIGMDFTSNIAFYLSRPFRASASIPKSELRFIGTFVNDGSTNDITTKYQELFKTIPTPDQIVLVKMVGFAQESGWISRVDINKGSFVQL